MGPGASWRWQPHTVKHKRRNRLKPGVLSGVKQNQMESGLPYPVLFTSLCCPVSWSIPRAEEREPGPPYPQAGRSTKARHGSQPDSHQCQRIEPATWVSGGDREEAAGSARPWGAGGKASSQRSSCLCHKPHPQPHPCLWGLTQPAFSPG